MYALPSTLVHPMKPYSLHFLVHSLWSGSPSWTLWCHCSLGIPRLHSHLRSLGSFLVLHRVTIANIAWSRCLVAHKDSSWRNEHYRLWPCSLWCRSLRSKHGLWLLWCHLLGWHFLTTLQLGYNVPSSWLSGRSRMESTVVHWSIPIAQL